MAQLIVSGNATASQVLTGSTFSAGALNGASGTMTNNGAVTITPSNVNQTIAGGYHNGSGNVPAVVVPAANVLTGITIAGTAGTMPNNGAVNRTPSNVAQGIPAGYTTGGTVTAVPVDATKVLTGTTIAGTAGTMPNNGSPTYTPSTVNQNISAGYISGGTVLGDADLNPNNILNGVNIFNVIGNVMQLTNEKKWASGTGTNNPGNLNFYDFNNQVYIGAANLTVTGLTFTPSVIYTWITSGTQGYNFFTVYYSGGVGGYGVAPAKIIVAVTDMQTTANILSLDGTNAYVNGSGFRLPNRYVNGGTQFWLAIA